MVYGTRRAHVALSRGDPGAPRVWPRADPRGRADWSRRDSISSYWQQVGKALAEVSYSRALWRTELDAALKLLAQGKLVAGLAQAARIGHTYETTFADHGRTIQAIRPPEGAEHYHAMLLALMDHLAGANARLARAATHRDLGLLAECGAFLRVTKQRLAELNQERDSIVRRYRLQEE